MIEYELQKTEDGDLIECDSCSCEVPTVNNDGRPLCEFCFTTMAGRMTEKYQSSRQPLEAEIWKAAAAVANYLKFKV